MIPEDEPDCDRVFEFEWEKEELDKETLQVLKWKE